MANGADSLVGHDTQQLIDSDVFGGLDGGQPRTEHLCCTVSRATVIADEHHARKSS